MTKHQKVKGWLQPWLIGPAREPIARPLPTQLCALPSLPGWRLPCPAIHIQDHSGQRLAKPRPCMKTEVPCLHACHMQAWLALAKWVGPCRIPSLSVKESSHILFTVTVNSFHGYLSCFFAPSMTRSSKKHGVVIPCGHPLHPWYSCHTFLYLSYSQACQHMTTLSKYLHCAVPRDLLPQIRGGKHYGCYYKMERSYLSTNEPGKSAQHVTFVPMFIHVQSQQKVAPCSWQLDHDCMSVRATWIFRKRQGAKYTIHWVTPGNKNFTPKPSAPSSRSPHSRSPNQETLSSACKTWSPGAVWCNKEIRP